MRTRAALEALFELLEEYAPMWYTEEHHNLAVDALGESAENSTSDAATQENVLSDPKPPIPSPRRVHRQAKARISRVFFT